MWLPWKYAAIISALLAGVGLLTRRKGRRPTGISALTTEAALVFLLYGMWQYAAGISLLHVDGAIGRGRSIMRISHWLPLPSEHRLQGWVLPHSWLTQFCNGYYAIMHVPALGIFLVWMFFRHRDRYPPWRNVLAALTGISLAIQLVPVAPPRLIPGAGFVDTALLFNQSVYGSLGAGAADQLSAMPSVHVGWASLIAIAAFTSTRSRWHWIAVAHGALTWFVVVATANHWWLDGIVELAILGFVFVVERAIRRRLRASRSDRSTTSPPLTVGARST